MHTRISLIATVAAVLIPLSSCQNDDSRAGRGPSVKEQEYGKLPDGREVRLFTISNGKGLKAKVMEYGATLVSLEVPDAKGKVADVTHGFDSLAQWVQHNQPYFGATVGRFAGRIASGRFAIDGTSYQLASNSQSGGVSSAFHGGNKGFDKRLWTGRIVDDRSVAFYYTSADGEEGYPGRLSCVVTYTLTDDNEMKWEAVATTDAPTVVNLAHQTYWNLSGNPRMSITSHLLTLNAPHYLPTDAGMIPTGDITSVSGTPMDFTSPHPISERLDADYEALRIAKGYDHCWVLENNEGIQLAARLEDPASGRIMEIYTDQPGIHFDCGNLLDGSIKGKSGVAYAARTALCLETGKFPNSPNQRGFSHSVLKPGETYRHTMIHRFLAK